MSQVQAVARRGNVPIVSVSARVCASACFYILSVLIKQTCCYCPEWPLSCNSMYVKRKQGLQRLMFFADDLLSALCICSFFSGCCLRIKAASLSHPLDYPHTKGSLLARPPWRLLSSLMLPMRELVLSGQRGQRFQKLDKRCQ